MLLSVRPDTHFAQHDHRPVRCAPGPGRYLQLPSSAHRLGALGGKPAGDRCAAPSVPMRRNDRRGPVQYPAGLSAAKRLWGGSPGRVFVRGRIECFCGDWAGDHVARGRRCRGSHPSARCGASDRRGLSCLICGGYPVLSDAKHPHLPVEETGDAHPDLRKLGEGGHRRTAHRIVVLPSGR